MLTIVLRKSRISHRRLNCQSQFVPTCFFVWHVLFGGFAGAVQEPEYAINLLREARDEVATARVDRQRKIDGADALVDVARAFAALGKVDEANRVVEMLRDDDDFCRFAIEAIAVEQARCGDFDRAFATLGQPRAGYAMLARREIAKLQARAGRVADAVKICETVSLPNPRRAAQFLEEVAAISLESHHRDGARLALDRARELLQTNRLDELDELTALQELAVAYARFGDAAAAQSLFARLKQRTGKTDESEDDSAGSIAMSLAEAGYFDETFQMAKRVDPQKGDFLTGAPRVEIVYRQIGLAAARGRHWDEAQRAVDLVERGVNKASVFAAESKSFWEAGQKREAADAFRSAMELTIASKSSAAVPEVIMACAELVGAELAHDAIAGAVAVTEQMPKTGARDGLLRRIVQRQASAGDLAGALKTVAKISTEEHVFAEDHRSRALQSIVEAEAESGAEATFAYLMAVEKDSLVHARLMIGRAVGLSKMKSTKD